MITERERTPKQKQFWYLVNQQAGFTFLSYVFNRRPDFIDELHNNLLHIYESNNANLPQHLLELAKNIGVRRGQTRFYNMLVNSELDQTPLEDFEEFLLDEELIPSGEV